MASNVRGPYTCLYREVWNDERFWSRSEIGRLVYLYILSSPLGNGLGCYKAGIASMVEDSRIAEKRFREGFAEGLRESFPGPLFKYDEHARVVLVTKYLERNAPNNPNGIKALGKAFITIPDCALKVECYQMVKRFVESKGESFRESFLESFTEPPGTISPSYSPSGSLSGSPSGSVPSTPTPPASPRGDGRRPSTDPDFEAFWEAYPRKVAKRDAAKAWKATAAERSPIDDVLAAVKAARLSEQWRRDGGQFVPYPASWLRAGRWADSVEVEGALPPESKKEREFRNDMDSLRKWGERRANRQGDHDGAGQLPAGICGLLGDRGTGGDVV